MREATSGTARLDTISYYNNSEANWDEKPYFTKVEEKRGRTGTHIDVGHNVEQSLSLDLDVQFSVVPGGSGRLPSEVVERMASQGTRVVLSGIGGDEVTGGVPTPIPELADLLATANFQTLAHQLKVWALNNRRPWLHLLLDTLREFFPAFLVGIPRYKQPASWLQPAFIKRNRRTFTGYETQLNLMGPRPSFQENMNTFRGLQRQLGCEMPIANPVHERRYPYLDRDLLEFLFAIPREQLVRPGQRRSLMRRALSNIVPHEVLNRKRKAYVARTPYASIAAQWQDLNGMTQNLISSSLRLVDKEKFIQGLLAARDGREMPIVLVMRTILIESWLKSHQTWIRSNSSLAAQSLSAPAHSQRDDTSKVERPSMALERVSGLPYLAARTNLS
jgi:asparagine synthase (glutamine-hydrolysing)